MRLKGLAAIVTFFVLTLYDGARAQQPERSVDTSPAWNDNSLIAVQKKGGNPSRSGDVKIEFSGHDAFRKDAGIGFAGIVALWEHDFVKWFARAERARRSRMQAVLSLRSRSALAFPRSSFRKLIPDRRSFPSTALSGNSRLLFLLGINRVTNKFVIPLDFGR